MSFNFSPKSVTDGLLMFLDAANAKSFAVGATAWTDVSRGDKDGALQNGATFSAANNGTIVFDGIDDRVRLQNTNLWFPISSGEFTIDVWIKSPGLAIGNTYNGIISLTYGLTLSTLSSGDVIFRVYDSVLSTTVNSTSIGVNCNDNRWHHIVATNDGTTSKIYIDGAFNISTPVSFNCDTDQTWYTNPKDDNIIFLIDSFDPGSMSVRLNVKTKDNGLFKQLRLDEEQFNNFLYQYSLDDYENMN